LAAAVNASTAWMAHSFAMASSSKTKAIARDRAHRPVAALLAVPLLAVATASVACTGAAPASDADDAGAASCPAAGTDFPVTKVVVGALTFDVRTAGPPTGEPVLLLHGFPQTSYEWRYQMQALADAGYHAIAPDQRGYSPGARPETTADYALTNMIADAIGLMGALGIDRYHVVGHDWGAAIAWGIAIVAPAQVITLTSVSIPAPGALGTVLADTTSCQYDDFSYYDAFVMPGSQDLFLQNGAQVLRGTYAELSPYAERVYMNALDSEDALGAAMNWYRANVKNRQIVGSVSTPVTVPTMLVWGDQDPVICRAGIDLTAQYVTAPYRLEVIQGADHWVPEVAAARLSEVLLEHLASSPAPSSSRDR
jgi:pimeloyl-ACP methyl ester carboxylesterase